MIFLFDVIHHEQVVWNVVFEVQQVENIGTAYFYPPIPNVPHWNVVYPKGPDIVFSKEQLNSLQKFYSSKGIRGYILDTLQFPSRLAVSTDEYLYQPKKMSIKDLRLASGPLSAREVSEISEFSSLVQKIFELDHNFLEDFKHQVERAQTSGIEMHHFIASCQGVDCGTWSTFKVSENYDFRMNLGLLPEFRGRKLSPCLSALASLNSRRQLMTHTNNDILRKSVLPRAGFESAGTVQLVPIDSALHYLNE